MRSDTREEISAACHRGPTYSAVTAFAASEARVAVRAEAHHSSGVSAVAAGTAGAAGAAGPDAAG